MRHTHIITLLVLSSATAVALEEQTVVGWMHGQPITCEIIKQPWYRPDTVITETITTDKITNPRATEDRRISLQFDTDRLCRATVTFDYRYKDRLIPARADVTYKASGLLGFRTFTLVDITVAPVAKP